MLVDEERLKKADRVWGRLGGYECIYEQRHGILPENYPLQRE
jgi:hypothetical protein